MAAASPIQVISQYSTGLYLTAASRCVRIKFANIDVPKGTRLEIHIFYSYDVTSKLPAWNRITNAVATATVADRTAEFFIWFGPVEKALSDNTAHVLLPRPNPNAGDSSRLPDLAYALRSVEGEWLRDGRVALCAKWLDLVYREARRAFNVPVDAIAPLSEFVATSHVYDRLKAVWDDVLCPVVAKDTFPYDDTELQFTSSIFHHLLRMANPLAEADESMPSLISRRLLCGSTEAEGAPLMRVFHTLLELVGRSKFIRRLHALGLLALAGSSDSIEFALGDAQLPAHVFFFRLPRSEVAEPAIVAELFSVGPNNHLVPYRPSPYVTMSQLERSSGDPLRAFASTIDSAHKDILRVLTYDSHMLCSSWTKASRLVVSPPKPIFHKNICHLDSAWWASSRPLPSHN